MKNGLPLAYALFRSLWSILHLALVGLAVLALVIWFVHDNQGVQLVQQVWRSLSEVQHTVANAIPFPWGG